MNAVSASAGEKNAVAPLPGLVEAIEARVGPVAFFDLSFPHCALLGLGVADVRLAGAGKLQSPAADFLASLRQFGGHQPIGTLAGPAEAAGNSIFPALVPANRLAVFYVADAETARRFAPLAEKDHLAFFWPLARPAGAKTGGEPPVIAGFEVLRLTDEAGQDGYWFAYPGALHPQAFAADAAPPAAAPSVRFAAPPRQRQVIAARHFVHDGGYAAEGDETYSWLWTGPSSHFRLLIPRAGPASPRRVEIAIIRTENAVNLEQLVVQRDGRPVPFGFDRWSENSGKVVVDIPPSEDYVVVGLVVPVLSVDKNNGRAIGLCVDKLILLPE